MPGFTTNAKSVFGSQQAGGFVRSGKKRHRYDLSQLPPKPKVKSPKLHALEGLDHTATHGNLTDSPLSGMGGVMKGDEELGNDAMDNFDAPGPGNQDVSGMPQLTSTVAPRNTGQPHPAGVNIQLDPAAHSAFKKFNARKRF